MGTVVKRDGAVVASAELGLGFPVDPGDYVVSTQVPGGALWEQQITIANGEKKRLMLEVKLAPSIERRPAPVASVVMASPPAGEASSNGRRVAVYAIGGAGVTGLVLGGVMGGLALGKRSTIEAHCGTAIKLWDPALCDQTGVDAGKSVKTLGLVSTVGFAAGLAGVGTAVVLLLTQPKPAKSATGARGSWISADMLSVGPTGATLGVHGSF